MTDQTKVHWPILFPRYVACNIKLLCFKLVVKHTLTPVLQLANKTDTKACKSSGILIFLEGAVSDSVEECNFLLSLVYSRLIL